MAGTFTYTFAGTKTFSRIDLLNKEIRIALRRTKCCSKEYLDDVERAVRKRWIEQLLIYALDCTELCRAEMVLKIDWKKHEAQIVAGKSVVVIDERWEGDTAIELDEMLNLFEEFVRTHSLTTILHTRYAAGVDRNRANAVLGWSDATAPNWVDGDSVGTTKVIPELREFCVGLRLLVGGQPLGPSTSIQKLWEKARRAVGRAAQLLD